MSKPPTGQRSRTTIGIWVETRELLARVCLRTHRTPQEQFAHWTEQEARELGIEMKVATDAELTQAMSDQLAKRIADEAIELKDAAKATLQALKDQIAFDDVRK